MTAPELSALQRRLNRAESRPGEDWLVLVENVPEWPEGAALPAEAPQAAHARAPFSYATSQGHPRLTEALVKREHEVSASRLVDESNVLVTAGGMHAIGLVLRDLADRGYRKAVHTTPVFCGVRDSMRAAGMRNKALPLTGTSHDLALLRRECTEPTVVYVNLPHNPTGEVLLPEYLDVLATLAAQPDVHVVYDAVYDSFDFGPDRCPTPVDLAVGEPGMTIVNSVSKNYGRPGDRIGWIVAAEENIRRLVPRLEWEAVSINGRAQLDAVAAISRGNTELVEAVRAGRAAYLAHARGPWAPDPVPHGGTQLWLDLGVPDIERFADFALERHHLVLTTSANYAPVLPGRIRFPTGIPAERLRRALTGLHEALADWETYDGKGTGDHGDSR
ncbi:beta-methylarginine biosynthesis bifunctional aminotransferase [Streptomyces sp. NBC_01565]|uniref:beta-methylarginine biosynthesis bifunctional aminotransferase n=1 Tax=unclassified Streptomyces TaxID=2593676 RepID=UPI002256991E|nr:beta-methylarginine biosynthesis bifunctional aminotransferase [Streptomyces sp. NBC_01565]MCX4539347.1 beta-methylarginine biosynthesis bifunctional aminotransferase [Streptomyces sp. NBC_01565]